MGEKVMTAKRIVPISEKYEIPSRGKVYGDLDVPSEFTLRAMTTLEEKMRLAGQGLSTIPNLINACLMSPTDFDTSILKIFDLQFLMYKLRIVTYGPEYKLVVRCDNCGKENDVVVNLDDLPVKYAEDNYIEPFTVGPLPVSGDIITCRILSANDFIEIEKESKRILSKTPNYVGDPEFILTYRYKISTINGQEVLPFKLQEYIEKMHARDMRFFDSKYADLTENIGLDFEQVHVCTSCGSDIKYTLQVTDEFFRPKY